MRIINVTDNAGSLNYGVWHAAIVNASLLQSKNISTELWFNYPDSIDALEDVTAIYLRSSSIEVLAGLIKERNLNPLEDIIITHGCWRFPTRWGAYLKKKGFKWIYVPQGMLENWSLKQKRIKKLFYFHLLEKRMVKTADIIRSVSIPEKKNLERLFPGKRVEFMPNAIAVKEHSSKKDTVPLQYLYLSRLHPKKNVLSLAKAWLSSTLNNDQAFMLLIVGPDQGELAGVEACIKMSRNMKYLGSVFGKEKEKVISSSSFYILPSYSEGLPSSLLEAMGFGLVPIITEGCNLPEVFGLNLGIKITTDIKSIENALEETAAWHEDRIRETGSRCKAFILENYSLDPLTEKQLKIYSDVLS